jgi:hypothetical protein
MLRPVLIRGLFGAALAAFALAGCAQSTGALPAAPVASLDATASLASPRVPLTATPKRLNFTTTPVLRLVIAEKRYKGKYKLAVFPPNLVKLSKKTAKGPSARIVVTALNAGVGQITIKDERGVKKIVPVSVTQGVIIIQ